MPSKLAGRDFPCIEIMPIPSSTGESINFRLFVSRKSSVRPQSIILRHANLQKVVANMPRENFPLEMGRITVNFFHHAGVIKINYQPYKELYRKKIWSFGEMGIAQQAEDKILSFLMPRLKGYRVLHEVKKGSERERHLLERRVNPETPVTLEQESLLLKEYLSRKRAESKKAAIFPRPRRK